MSVSQRKEQVENVSMKAIPKGLTHCEECKSNPSKYKCPGCSIQSCSLPCVKAHKTCTGCTGKRNQTQFVPISQFDDSTLLSGTYSSNCVMLCMPLNLENLYPVPTLEIEGMSGVRHVSVSETTQTHVVTFNHFHYLIK